MSWIRCFSVLPQWIQFEDRPPKPTVVVAGYGWAAHSFIQNLSYQKYNVKVISERPCRLNQNLMIGNLTPSYTPAVTDIIQDTCLTVDKEKKIVHGGKNNYAYDYLVVATGSEVNDFGIPGVQEHCLKCKTDTDIRKIRENCPKDSVILGAGPTGLELACALHKQGVKSIRVIEAAPTILPGFSEQFRNYVYQHLIAKGVKLILDNPITEIKRDKVITKKSTIPVVANEIVIWTCGVKPVAFARSLDGKVNEHFQHSPFVYVIGDACRNQGPPTAQNASQQGSFLAAYFNSQFTRKEPYKFNELGRCLDLGDGYLMEIYGFMFFLPITDMTEIIMNMMM